MTDPSKRRRYLGLALVGVTVTLTVTLALGGRHDSAHAGGSNGDAQDPAQDREPPLHTIAGAPPGPAVAKRHVSSAARDGDTEGHDDDGWDQLGRAGRIARTEQSVAALQLELQQTSDTLSREQLRDRAQRVLSEARSDYFLDQAGQLRYLELEAEFED
jgi:hypothetical protein